MKHETRYRMPAEWERQQAVMLTWPHANTDWQPCLGDINRTMTEVAKAVARHEDVLIVAPFESDVPEEVRRLDNAWLFRCPTDDTWARDHGPVTLLAEGRKPLWLDFQFNGWGRKFPADYDNCITIKLWSLTSYFDEVDFENHDDFVLEGGSIESDGKGTVFTTAPCLLAPNRNQPLTQEEIEQELKRRLRAERIVWLNASPLPGDDTDGHIDTLMRCAPDDTLLYVPQLEDEVSRLRTLEGKPYRLIALPTPLPIIEDGQPLPATYANFLVINGAVIVPTYGQPDNDREAVRQIGEAFPGRDIIPIDSRTIIRQHGSIHCMTMQLYSWRGEERKGEKGTERGVKGIERDNSFANGKTIVSFTPF